jgi:purine catabolism regulator
VTVTNSLQTAASTDFTLGDLVALIGLTLLPGSRMDPRTPVNGGAGVERPDAVDQLEPQWVAVTEGSGFTSAEVTEPVLRDFVRAMAYRSTTALVVRLGRVWDRVPPAIVDEANHQGLPILSLPADFTPATLLRTIHDAAGNQAFAIVGRALSVQTDLIDALTYPDVERELVNRLSTRLGVAAILYDNRREVLASQGEAPIHLVKDHIDPTADSERRLTIGRWSISISPLGVPGGVYWLALGWTSKQDLTYEIVRSTRYALQKLLSAHITTVSVSRRQDQVQRAQLLTELLEGVSAVRLARLRDQLVLLAFPREGDYNVHLVQPRTPAVAAEAAIGVEASANHVLDVIQVAAESHQTSVLLTEREHDFVILLPQDDALVRDLVAAIPDAEHGISSTFSDLGQVSVALRQAEMSLMTSTRRGTLTPFDEVGFINFVLAQVPAETLNEKARAVLAGMPEGGLVEQTVLEYLQQGMDVQATARVMHLHPNSIRYRLGKAEDALGRSLTDPETITLLYLTLHDRFARTPQRSAVDTVIGQTGRGATR